MPKLKTGTIVPTPKEDAAITAAALADPDAMPFTDEEWAQVKPRRGRPPGSGSKVQLTLRLDADVVERFRAQGDGWQTRMNDVLKNWARRHA